jgi:hypothetical protein
MVLIQWAGAYVSYQRSVRLITGRDAARAVSSHVDFQRSASSQ